MRIAAVDPRPGRHTGLVGLSQWIINDLGSAAPDLFTVLADGAHLPLAMRRDSETAVMSAGCGLMLSTTASAMANMEALVERHGLAPRAFLVVPTAGVIITAFVNVLR